MPDSIHEGTIIEINDKGAVVALQYGVEGFVTPKHLVKEDGTTAKVDEKLPFKVIEFSKSAKKIILSHTRVHEDERKSSESEGKKVSAGGKHKATRKVKAGLEKTTLGDITELAALKNEMEKRESKKKKEKENDEDGSIEPKDDAKAKKSVKKAKKEDKAEESEN